MCSEMLAHKGPSICASVQQVAEHLELYAAIKGYSRKDAQHIARAAAADVGMHSP